MADDVTLPPIGEPVAGAIRILDERARSILDEDARLVRLTDGAKWAEGPVALPDGTVMFSDIPNDRALAWSEAKGQHVWRQPNDYTNGNTLDHEGRIVHCEHGPRRVARTELDGTRHALVDRYEGKRLNSPNDVVVKSDGTIWFTDPPYGILSNEEGYQAPQEQAACYVFRYDPADGSLTAVSDAMIHPNGLAFSVDESRLYVSDTSSVIIGDAGNHHLYAFDVVDGRTLGPRRDFYEMDPGLSDGFRVDEHDHLWTSAGDGFHVLAPDGTLVAKIVLPEKSSNGVFGGRGGRQLFMTVSSSLWVVDTRVRGAGVAAAVARGERPS